MHEVKQNSALALGAFRIIFEQHHVHQAARAPHEHHAAAALGAARAARGPSRARLPGDTRASRGDVRRRDRLAGGPHLPTGRGQVELELELRA